MTPAESEILAAVRGFAAANRIIVTKHAQQRMRARGVTYADLRCSLTGATFCESNDPTWKVTGPDLDGDSVTSVVEVQDGIIVVTVF